MTASDDEFEDFLKRRKHKFRAPDDVFGPPEELDRVVLRQAREAIETPRPLGVFRGPRWAAPVALAATLVLAVGVVFHAGVPQKREPVAEVSVQSVAQRVDYPAADMEMAPAPAPSPIAANKVAREALDASGPVVVDLAAPAEARGFSPPPPAAPVMASNAAENPVRERAEADASLEPAAVAMSAPAAKSAAVPAWRRDTKSWLAEIERLRNAGDTARADAELAEYKRQQRAYAGAPDR